MRGATIVLLVLAVFPLWGGVMLTVNEATTAFGWGTQVTIHIDHNFTYRGTTSQNARRTAKRDVEGHYSYDGTTYRTDVDGNYPVGSDVTGYLPLLGGAPITKTGGTAIFLAIVGMFITFIGLVFLLIACMSFASDRRKAKEEKPRAAAAYPYQQAGYPNQQQPYQQQPARAVPPPRPQQPYNGPMRYQGPPQD